MSKIDNPPPETNLIGLDPFKPACPNCTWIETNLGRQLDKKCDLHQKIEDLQSDLSLERSINSSSSSMMAELCQIIRADDDDNPLEVARERMAEIEALEQELGAPAPETNLRVDVEAEIASAVQSVNEWDDRTSPDDYPDHLLITSEELTDILRNFADTLEGRDNG